LRIRFITSTPLDIQRGSGTYVGMHVLARALRVEGHEVAFEAPQFKLPVYTAQRLLFNWGLRPMREFDVTVGFDMDGYRIASADRHVAALKGVIADEVRYERGLTRLTMSIQARCERLHVHGASRVLVTSRYSADRASEFYGLTTPSVVVPELIELDAWRGLLRASPASPSSRFTVLFVGRMYRRKRLEVLLQAAAQVRDIEVRIVGNGPCAGMWRRLSQQLRLEKTVAWLGDVSRAQLAAEYKRCDAFCLPSVQEGFGIVLLEAMAAGKAIVASRAAAIPEVVPHAVLVEPESPDALAAALQSLRDSEDLRSTMGRQGAEWVCRFDAPSVVKLFLGAITDT
jgi:glycosyltransferase involved in cell wall biosynthesis